MPEAATARDAFATARVLADLRSALAAEGLSIQDVAGICKARPGYSDHSRWSALAEIEAAYLAELDASHLEDDAAVASGSYDPEVLPDAVVCAGVPELPGAIRSVAERLPISVTCLAYAPPTEAGAFDGFGCVRPAAWLERHIELREECIRLVSQPRDQARAALQTVAELADRVGPEDVTIGLGDLQLRSMVRRTLDEAGVPTHSAYARPLASTRPFQLLGLVGGYLAGGDAEAFAGLVRHPDLDRAVRASVDATAALHDLDTLRRDRLPSRIAGPSTLRGDVYPRAHQLVTAVGHLLSGTSGGRRPICDWAEPIARVLSDAYDADVLAPSSSDLGSDWLRAPGTSRRGVAPELAQSLEATGELLRDLARTVTGLATEATVTAPEAIGVLAHAARSIALPEPYEGPAVELLDWFELHADDAPAKIVVGMNEGCVPERVPRDPFLTDTLRADLGMPIGAHRYARDAYLLTALSAGQCHLTLIAGTSTADGEPALPSRLLLAADDATLVARAKRSFGAPSLQAPQQPVLYTPAQATTFAPARPRPLDEPIAGMRVTAFRDYLACPYRFYLKHILKLERVADRAEELGPAAFGLLLHEVVSLFLRHPDSDAVAMPDALRLIRELLSQVARDRLGSDRLGSVEIQISLMRRRLERFVASRLEDRAAGWRTRPDWVEAERQGEIVVDDSPFRISGRIDCLDVNEATGQYRILDFKSSDSEPSPERYHRRNREGLRVWVDLQLPLYRLIAPFPEGADLTLAFLWLTPDPDKALVRPARWGTDDLDSADECARSVIRSIRGGVFWPPAEEAPAYDDGLTHLCMDRCSERHLLLQNPPAPWGDQCAV